MKYWYKRILYLIKENLVFDVLRSHLKHSKKQHYSKKLPLISIEEITSSNDFLIYSNDFEDGNISNFELECICRIARHISPENVFEIGTFNGRSALNIAANTPSSTNIYTLDLPIKEISKTKLRIKSGEKKFINKSTSGTRFIGTKYESRIFQIYADSAQFDYSGFNNKMDLVFIDGSHSYEYVVNDTNVAINLLRNGKGVILWHDYGWHEVIQALNEFFEKDKRFNNLKNISGTSIAYLKVK